MTTCHARLTSEAYQAAMRAQMSGSVCHSRSSVAGTSPSRGAPWSGVSDGRESPAGVLSSCGDSACEPSTYCQTKRRTTCGVIAQRRAVSRRRGATELPEWQTEPDI